MTPVHVKYLFKIEMVPEQILILAFRSLLDDSKFFYKAKIYVEPLEVAE
jgi:hypothetical protein